MGFFDVFKKKECDICGGEIGLLGNRKLEDGNLCKECAKKLSPWFDDRRHSTIEEIRAQLAYREENKKAVEAFQVTRTLGRNYTICFDEDAKKFLVAQGRDFRKENPDVLDFSQVTGCDLDVDQDRDEIKRTITNREGETEWVSYNPPRYRYSYDFYMVIRVRHPYFDDIRFRLNSSTIHLESAGSSGLFGMGGGFDPTRDVEYREYEAMGREIKEILSQARQSVRDEVAAANAPRAAVTCPYCGATTTPDASGKCEYCGGAVNG